MELLLLSVTEIEIMIKDKYSGEIKLQCPNCGESSLNIIEESDESNLMINCDNCGKSFDYDELIKGNSGLIEEKKQKLAEEAFVDFKKQFNEDLSKKFKGNKNLRFK